MPITWQAFDTLPRSSVWEESYGLDTSLANGALGNNGADGDPDQDGLVNLEEYNAGSNPLLADSDEDGISDYTEVYSHQTSPSNPDSDGDGSSDGEEVFFASNPNDATIFPLAGQTLAGMTSAGSVGPYLDGMFPPSTPSTQTGTGENWATEVAFPDLSFAELKGIVSEPRSSNLHVIERQGTVQQVNTNDPTSKFQVMNISSSIEYGDNGGLRSVVFHPEYNLPGSPNRNYIYCFYSTTASTDRGFTSNDGSFFYRLSRFTRDEASGTFPTSSELVLIQHHSLDQGQHFGGSLSFDLDGFLLICWGDKEYSSARIGNPFYQDVQRVDRIFQGAVLRLDIDNQGGAISHFPTRTLQGASVSYGVPGTSQSCETSHHYYHIDNFSGRDYMIPSDNYYALNPPAAGDGSSFANTPAHGPALEEHHATGTRNPWRMAVDPVDGHIALFNVGSNRGQDFEEIELVTPGYNGGWPYLEGVTSQTSETGRSGAPAQYAPTALGNETTPIAFWDHSSGRTASGGLFYRGSLWSTDFCRPSLWIDLGT